MPIMAISIEKLTFKCVLLVQYSTVSIQHVNKGDHRCSVIN